MASTEDYHPPHLGGSTQDDGEGRSPARALENTDGLEDAVRAEVLTVARRRKMSVEAIIRAGTDIGAAPRPTSERPLTVEEAVKSLVQHFLSAARAAQSSLDENEEDQANQQDECDGVEATVSTHATHHHTHKGGLGETLADGNPRLEGASKKEFFSMIQRLVSTLDEERIASKDRELRLNQKINELSAQVESLTERLTDLGKETQARDEKLTRRVNDVKACVMSAYSNTPTRTKAHSPTRDTLTAHAETNAYTAAATYSELSVSLEATATLRHGISTGEDISIHDHHQKCRKVASEAS